MKTWHSLHRYTSCVRHWTLHADRLPVNCLCYWLENSLINYLFFDRENFCRAVKDMQVFHYCALVGEHPSTTFWTLRNLTFYLNSEIFLFAKLNGEISYVFFVHFFAFRGTKLAKKRTTKARNIKTERNWRPQLLNRHSSTTSVQARYESPVLLLVKIAQRVHVARNTFCTFHLHLSVSNIHMNGSQTSRFPLQLMGLSETFVQSNLVFAKAANKIGDAALISSIGTLFPWTPKLAHDTTDIRA